ncbi:MAG: hypothetical protein D6711_09815 [Chloroflexi bacterium]|nr:MAG: hypothetical protein D6711_09815 [Chloroflexota bacterium]
MERATHFASQHPRYTPSRKLIMMRKWLFLCVLFIHITLSAQQDEDRTFGIVEGMWYPDLTCALGVGWERLIFDWSAHQPNNPDEFVGFLNIPDEWIIAAHNCNREIVAVVKNVPAWATDGLPGAGVPRGLYLPVDDPQNLWANFMRMAAAYYAPRGINRFIILNEPDIEAGTYGFEFEGNLEDYFMMVKVAYLAAKQGNPAAQIHLAGTTYWHDVNSGERLYTDRLLERITHDPQAATHNYYFDALSLHIYFRTDTVYDIVTVYRNLLDQYGFRDKAIWVTETNASPNLDPNWQVDRPQFQITLQQQASFIIQSAVQALAAGAERIAVYKLYDQFLPPGAESFGILNPADSTPRPAFYSWQTVTRHLTHIATAHLGRNDRVTVVQITHTDARQTLVMWSRTEQTTTVEVTATADKAYLIDQYGNLSIIRPDNGVYLLTLPGANCEPPPEGCVVGGAVSLLVQPNAQTTITEITPFNRYQLDVR